MQIVTMSKGGKPSEVCKIWSGQSSTRWFLKVTTPTTFYPVQNLCEDLLGDNFA